jgi:hypothetical protein
MARSRGRAEVTAVRERLRRRLRGEAVESSTGGEDET